MQNATALALVALSAMPSFAVFAPAVHAGVSQTKGNVCVETSSLVATLSANRNYCPVIEGVGANGKFGILLQARIWYHGRTGNTQRFYQD